MRLRLAGGTGSSDTGGEHFPIETPADRRARMALAPVPTPTIVVRSDAEIRRMQSDAEQAAGIGRHDPDSADLHAEGFLCCLQWLKGNLDDTSVTLNWLGELP